MRKILLTLAVILTASMLAVPADASGSLIHIARSESRHKHVGEIYHRTWVFWTWNFRLNTSSYYQWAKFKTLTEATNVAGTHQECGFWGIYKGTEVTLYVKNNTTGRNFSQHMFLPCDEDTKVTKSVGLTHKARMYWRGGTTEWKVLGHDKFGWGKKDEFWQVGGKIVRP